MKSKLGLMSDDTKVSSVTVYFVFYVQQWLGTSSGGPALLAARRRSHFCRPYGI